MRNEPDRRGELSRQPERAGSVDGGSFYLEPIDLEAKVNPQKKSFVDYFHLILHRKLLLIAFGLTGLALAAVVTTREVPMYRAETTLEIRNVKTGSGLINPQSDTGTISETDSDLETQIRILESGALAQRVATRLRREHPGRVYEPQDLFAAWRRRLKLPPAHSSLRTTKIPPVQVKAVVLGTSRIVQVTCESWDPHLAAEYASDLASEYIDYSLEELTESSSKVGNWLYKQVRDARAQLEQSENQLHQYTLERDLVYMGDAQNGSADDQKLRQLQDDLAKATANRMVKQAAYEVAKASPAEAVPEIASNDRLSTYQSKLAELRREYAELRAVYTDSHYKVVAVQAQINEMEGTLARERATIVERIQNEYQQTASIERMLTSAYKAQLPKAADTARKGIEYGLMKWDVDTNQRIYEELLARVKAITIGSTLHANASTILDAASVPRQAFQPVVGRNLIGGGFSGLALAIMMILVSEVVNRSLNAPGESQFQLGIPELGVIPSHPIVNDPKSTPIPKILSINTGKDSKVGSRVELVTWEDRPSVMAEAYRSALASILLASGRRPKVIVLTSSGRREGKSSTVSNLGIALAEINQKVILVDADLRKPSLHGFLNIANTWGLSDILREKSSLEDSPLVALAKPTAIAGLYLLPSGPGTTSIASLLYSERMTQLFDRLRKEFDTVIIDTPPLSYVSDARILGRLADGAVLVVRAGVTTRDAASACKRRLQEDGIPILGTILNDWDGRSKSRYGYGYETYTYNYLHESD